LILLSSDDLIGLPGFEPNGIRSRLATRELTMRSFAVHAVAMSFAICGNANAQAAAIPDISHYMVIIATSTSGAASGVQMTTLSFPSERACAAAAAIFAQSTPGANVVARCAPQK
jgi:Cu/Ag efflux pump CusA